MDPGPWDWPTYGQTPSTRSSVAPRSRRPRQQTLKEAWEFPTGDAVTATPTVVDGTVYVGSWDTKFYAINLATGKLDWAYQLDQQHGVTPYPGEDPATRHQTVD